MDESYFGLLGQGDSRISDLPLHPFTKGGGEPLLRVSADVRFCAHLVVSALPPKADIG